MKDKFLDWVEGGMVNSRFKRIRDLGIALWKRRMGEVTTQEPLPEPPQSEIATQQYGLSDEIIEKYMNDYPALSTAPRQIALMIIAEVENMKMCTHKSSYCGDELTCRACPLWEYGTVARVRDRIQINKYYLFT